MDPKILIELQHECSFNPLPSDEAILSWVEAALHDRVPEGTELCVRLVDTTEIQTLNHEYRDKDKPTNVLSFPVELPDGVNVPLLGDIVICPSIVFDEAQAQHKTYEQHFAHIVIHGCLHLLGYDHVTDAEADVMEPLEISILATINIPNPYKRERS